MEGLKLLGAVVDGILKLKSIATDEIIGSTSDDGFGCCCGGGCCCCEPRRLISYSMTSETDIEDILPPEIFVGGGDATDCRTNQAVCCCNKFEVWAVRTQPIYLPNTLYPIRVGTGIVDRRSYGDEGCYIDRTQIPGFHLGLKSYIAWYELWVMCDALTACCDVTDNTRTENKSPDEIFSKCCGVPGIAGATGCCLTCSKRWREEACPDECDRYEDAEQRKVGRCFSYGCKGERLEKPKNC